MHPHQIITQMRGYQEALRLIEMDLQEELRTETDPDRLNKLSEQIRRRASVSKASSEIEHQALKESEQALATLDRYANELRELHRQLQTIIEHPSSFEYAFRNKQVRLDRLQSILRRSLHAYSLEFGWLMRKTAEPNWAMEFKERLDELVNRIEKLACALNPTKNVFRSPSIHYIFGSTEK